jgi:peptidoglycan DL-endopeptidase LytE
MKTFSNFLLFLFFIFSFFSVCEAETRHTVKKGETLSSIAQKYHVDLTELKKANASKKKLIAGEKILIPSKKQIVKNKTKSDPRIRMVAKKTGDNNLPKAQGAASESTAANRYHSVKKGDTLSSISRKHSITLSELSDMNRLSKSAKLKVGQKLLVSSAKPEVQAVKNSQPIKSVAVTDKVAPEESGAPEIPAADLYHSVKKGDTLSSIARKHSVTLSKLRDLNHLSKSAKLKVGQKLLVSSAELNVHIVKDGDTLKSIAANYKVSPEELMEINEITSAQLKKGQKLYLSQDQPATAKLEDIEILKRTLEQEIKAVSDSEEFSDKTLQDKLVVFAKKLLNIPYKFGGNSILGIDCSAYVKKVYGLLGVDLPRTAREQFNKGETIEKEELTIGDLVFFRTYASFPSHVGIYMGNNLFIHASEKGKKVKVDNLNAPYFVKRFIGAKRLLVEDEPATTDPTILSATE